MRMFLVLVGAIYVLALSGQFLSYALMVKKTKLKSEDTAGLKANLMTPQKA